MTKSTAETQDFESLPTVSPPPSAATIPSSPQRRLLLFLPVIIFVFLALLLLATLLRKSPSLPLAPSPSPSPTPPLTEIFNSPWATDSAVIQIEANLKTLESQLSQVDLKQTLLLPPSIQLNLQFDTP